MPALLAYQMNGAELTPAHGAPLRVVIPGVIGARSVKWVKRILIKKEESQCFYQTKDCEFDELCATLSSLTSIAINQTRFYRPMRTLNRRPST